ncbi:MAG: two-component system response regulator [Rhodobacteraceae bacterium]|nr:two-component system response regulator [Paracoccaceae bacterium]
MAFIVLVDDDISVLTPLTEQLESEGYKVQAFQSSIDAKEFFRKNSPDLAIFDIKMPQLNGYQLLKEVRLNNPTLPIIFLSSKIEEQDELIGFTLGADDYITKPFSKHLLLARVTAVLRRHQTKIVPKIEKIIKADALEIDQERHLVTWKEIPVDLTVTESMLLVSLAIRPGMVKNRSQLMDAAYDGTIYVSDRTIDSHIRNIRNKLKAADSACDIILTVHGLGYKLNI